MSPFPFFDSDSDPHPDSDQSAAAGGQLSTWLTTELRAADLITTAFASVRGSIGALEALEIRILAAASAIVREQNARLAPSDVGRRDINRRAMVAELAVAVRVSERALERKMSEADDLCERFPETLTALAAGAISRQHVGIIHEAGWAIIDDDDRRAYTDAAIERAEAVTPGRLRPIVQLLAARADTRTIDERHREARARRRVNLVDQPDGMAELILLLPATLAHGIMDRCTQQAHSVIEARRGNDETLRDADTRSGDTRSGDTCSGDMRSIDEVRADILADLLLTGTPTGCIAGDGLAAIRAAVQVTVPVLTLAGVDDAPALLAGYGPIDADTARRLAGTAPGWDRVMTHPTTGAVLGVDRYRPSAELIRFLDARDEHCRFPGCRMPARRCDKDHTIDAAKGGLTCAENLENLCQGHHTLKHASAWRIRQLGGGRLEWTSPTGRSYIDTPEPVLRFVPDEEPLPLVRVWRTAAPDDPVWHFRDDGDPPCF